MQPDLSTAVAHLQFGRWRVLRHTLLASTNETAALHAASGAAWCVIVADEQTAGRGQHGRRWLSPAGDNLLASFIVPKAAASGASLALAVPLAICDVLDAAGIAAAGCKWPNDVLAAGAKIAGILVEAGAAFCAGVGSNVNWPATRLRQPEGGIWTSIRAESGTAHDPMHLLASLCAALDDRLAQPATDVLRDYQARWLDRGMNVEANIEGSWLPGRATGIGPDGALGVAIQDNRVVAVHSSACIRYPNT